MAHAVDKLLVSFSHLKAFSKCPRLYKEQYIDKTYVPPPQDYFTYGSLVDAMLTAPETVDTKFVRVERRVDASKVLQIEEDMKGLIAEMEAPDKKGLSMRQKAADGNKTAVKGIEAREAKLAEKEIDLKTIRELGNKTQVTPAMWDDCEQTTESIRNNPTYKQILKANPVYQVTLQSTRLGRKGTLDILVMSAPLRTLFLAWNMDITQYEEFRKNVDALPAADRWVYVWDIKTCAALAYEKFEAETYAGQLEMYRSLVLDVLGIEPLCGLVVGDKDASRKMTQDYIFKPETLARAGETMKEVEAIFRMAFRDNHFPPAKQIRGVKQQCFTCTMCSDRPYSLEDPIAV
jgi:hypothetical protein